LPHNISIIAVLHSNVCCLLALGLIGRGGKLNAGSLRLNKKPVTLPSSKFSRRYQPFELFHVIQIWKKAGPRRDGGYRLKISGGKSWKS
jgi:hypothetical protein